MKIIVTGSAGFIGFSLCMMLLERGDSIIGIDNHNNYYDPKIKESRLQQLTKYSNYQHYRVDLSDQSSLDKIFNDHKPLKVVNLAAQAGVRYSMENPLAYINSNIVGFANTLESCRHHKVEHLVYASSSSVYGANTKMPFSEHDNVNHPLSVYAASKKSNELMAHSYSYLYQLPTTGLRFFTVYGPWGRPDMALFKFTKNILENKKIDLFNNGNQTRDFVYIDDVVECIILSVSKIPRINRKWFLKKPNPKSSYCPYRLINVGSDNPTKLSTFIRLIEMYLGKKSKQKNLPFQKSDIIKTESSSQWCYEILKYKPKIKPTVGIKRFLDWYKNYYQ